IRLQGPNAARVAGEIFQSKGNSLVRNGEHGRLHYGEIVDGVEVFDEGLLCVDSARGIEFVDLCVHGGTRVIERILNAAERHGATALSLDISAVWSAKNRIESEALESLVNAKTTRSARFLIRQKVALPQAILALTSQNYSFDHVRAELTRLVGAYPSVRRLID